MKLFSLLDRLIQTLAKLALACSGAIVIALVVLGAGDRILTQFFLLPIPSSIEFQQVLEASLIFLALAGVQHFDAHIRIDVLTDLIGSRVGRFPKIFGLVIVVIFYGFISSQAYLLVSKSFLVDERSPGRIDFPVYYFKLLVFAGMLIAFMEACRQLVRELSGSNFEQPKGEL